MMQVRLLSSLQRPSLGCRWAGLVSRPAALSVLCLVPHRARYPPACF